MSLLSIIWWLGVALVLVLLTVYLSYQYYQFHWSGYRLLPHRPPRLLFGNTFDMERDNSKFWKQLLHWHATWGRPGLLNIWVAHEPVVGINKPEYIEALLGSNELLHKDSVYDFMAPWLGRGLLTSLPSKWHIRRKLLTPAFHFNILDGFVPIFNDHADVMAELFEQNVGSEPVDIFPFVTRCTLDIICQTAMGKRTDAQHQPDSSYVKAVSLASQMVMNRSKQPWFSSDFMYDLLGPGLKFRRIIRVLHEFTLSVIRDRRKAFGSGDQSSSIRGTMAFLDVLLSAKTEDGQLLSDEDIREEVDTFMFEGHDTTSAAISWALFMLAVHKDIQAKVHAELDEIFGSSVRPADPADLRSMKYLECVIKETLRLYPSVAMYGRRLCNDLVLGDGKYTISRGTRVFIYAFAAHRLPESYPDPERFDPSRFEPENCVGRHPFAYVPFSAGPRNCIGQKFAMMEEKVVLSSILRRFRLSTSLSVDDVPPSCELVTRPAKPMLVRFDYRDV